MLLNTIQARLQASFVEHSTRCAIEYKNSKITYKELEEKAEAIAYTLLSHGVQKEEFVGIYTKDKVQHIISIIATLKAGCVFVPLDPTYPVERTKAMIAATETKYVLTDDGTLDLFEEEIVKEIQAIVINPKINEQVDANGKSDILFDPNDKIYIFFTSGTTGTPKAIIGRNESLVHFIDWEIAEFQINRDCRVSQFTGVCHDPVLRDIFVPLFAGGTICIPENKEIMLESNSLMEWIEVSQITLIHCTPSLFRLINGKTLSSDSFSSLQYVMLAGERILPKTLISWYEVMGERVQLVSLYGPTETTLAKVFYRIAARDVHRMNIPLGKAIPGSKVAILDDNLQFSVQGVTGQIYIRTPYRTLGYFNNEELQNEKFIPNPFNNQPDDLMYCTGDLGRMLEDGSIEFMGRKDRQIKLRGFRVELNELENVLLLHEKVKESAVIAKSNDQDSLHLCAYIVIDSYSHISESNEQTSREIRQFLSLRLPDYMVPQYIMLIDKLPMNANGKVDYKALPDPEQQQYIAPIDDIERKLAEIWIEILGIKQVGRKDRFLESGGHSLNVISLVYRVHEEYNVELPLAEVFRNITLEELANYVRDAS
ncbi:non-ribosomal peptide synthetase [Paenibacillus tyrfis]|uniref:Carrier domain-containing protein n=1 Tax=Paenibacillus tyrfis TaxID=1501230 RepID=A0A081NTN0_9BACL|nr:non-ribosomal peptide synthetase [Paenibacillus tyrfis]KEQ21803.1 hypothetical protein ET33_30795 [Paenibacillus tyrfis]